MAKEDLLKKIVNFIENDAKKESMKLSKELAEKYPWDTGKGGCEWICSGFYAPLHFIRKLYPDFYFPPISSLEDKCKTVEEICNELLKISYEHLKIIKYIIMDINHEEIDLHDLLEKDINTIQNVFKQDHIKKNMKKNKSCKNCGSFGNNIDGKLKKCSGCFHVFYCDELCQNSDWKKHKKECK